MDKEGQSISEHNDKEPFYMGSIPIPGFLAYIQ
jgi:hypothetical protein